MLFAAKTKVDEFRSPSRIGHGVMSRCAGQCFGQIP
jgi:hypothetical protein